MDAIFLARRKGYTLPCSTLLLLFPCEYHTDISSQNSFENSPQLDVLVIPGTFAAGELTIAASAFVTNQTRIASRVSVLSISSGISSLIQTGILHHKRATGPPSILSSLRQRYPETSWRDTEWMRHDNIWTSSSAVTAVDMIASWMRQYFWDRREAVECALRAAGISPLS